MGDCNFCGQPAGFLRHQHKECRQRYDEGKRQIVDIVSSASSTPAAFKTLPNQIKNICDTSHIPDVERRSLMIQGWSDAVDSCLHDHVISQDEEKQLFDLKDQLSLSRDELDNDGSFTKIVKSAVIRDLTNGIIPKRFNVEGSLPINFQKGEEIVWAFNDIKYYEDRIHRQYVGGSQGVSVRVMKGVYYRVGAFKGQAIDTTQRTLMDRGVFVLTTKQLYFSGPSKSFRIPYAKIVSFQPFSDGVGIVRDAASAKPQIFVTGDGWFTYNLVTNLAHL